MFTDLSRGKCKHFRRNTKTITNKSQLFQIIIVVIRFYLFYFYFSFTLFQIKQFGLITTESF